MCNIKVKIKLSGFRKICNWIKAGDVFADCIFWLKNTANYSRMYNGISDFCGKSIPIHLKYLLNGMNGYKLHDKMLEVI